VLLVLLSFYLSTNQLASCQSVVSGSTTSLRNDYQDQICEIDQYLYLDCDNFCVSLKLFHSSTELHIHIYICDRLLFSLLLKLDLIGSNSQIIPITAYIPPKLGYRNRWILY